MRRGIVTRLPNEAGGVSTLRVLCSFEYCGDTYLLISDKKSGCSCAGLKWNIWKGTYVVTRCVSPLTRKAAGFILEGAKNEPESFDLLGEHYIVEYCPKGFSAESRPMLRKLKEKAKIVPFLSRVAVALFFALVYACVYVNTCLIAAAVSVFGDIPRRSVEIAVYIIECVGTLALTLIRKEDRGLLDLIFYSIIPINTLTLIAALKVSHPVRWLVGIIVCASFLFLILPKLFMAFRKRRLAPAKKYLFGALSDCFTPFTLCVAVGILAVFVFGLNVATCVPSRNTADVSDYKSLYETICKGLNAEEWEKKLSVQEKVDLLQSVCQYECGYVMGFEVPRVEAADLGEWYLYGQYDDLTGVIQLNIDLVLRSDPDQAVETLLHETRHAYQHALVKAFNGIEGGLDEESKKLLCFKTILMYRENFDDYHAGEEDYDTYYEQIIEKDSREWASYRMSSEYYSIIHTGAIREGTPETGYVFCDGSHGLV